jgi:hypothetical protein
VVWHRSGHAQLSNYPDLPYLLHGSWLWEGQDQYQGPRCYTSSYMTVQVLCGRSSNNKEHVASLSLRSLSIRI